MAATVPPAETPWLVGLCSVIFDVDVGQTVQHVVPKGALTTDEESAISFCSFPDSLSMELCLKNSIRDSSFHFRVPCSSSSTSSTSCSAQGPAEGRTQHEDTLSSAPAAPHYLYGYVFCRQRQDESLRRGGEQSSLVVISRAPLSSVLAPLAQVAGPLFFSQGPQALQQVFEEVCSWPPPVPGASMSLPLAGTTITARLPSFLLLPPPQPPVDPEVQLHLARRSSSKGLARWHSLTSTSSLSTMGSAGLTQEQLAPTTAAAAAAAPAQPLAEQPPSPTKQQQASSGGGAAVGAQQAAERQPSSSSSGSSHAASANGNSNAPANSQSGGGAVACAADAAVATPASPARRRPPPPSEAEELALTAPHAELPTYTTFAALLRHMWHLWELLLLGHPLMVVGPSPRDCSTAVSCLLALITPLPYSADFQPYFTIHDSAFLGIQAYFLQQQQQQQKQQQHPPAAAGDGGATKQPGESEEGEEGPDQEEGEEAQEGPQEDPASQQPQASQQQHQKQLWELGLPVLLGITNLYLLRALPQWKTVLSVGNKEAAMSRPGAAAAAAAAANSSSGTGYFSGALRALRRRSQGTQSLLSDYSQNLWAAPKALTRPDHRLITNWQALACEPGSSSSSTSGGGAAAGGGPQAAGKALRRHFAELTLAVLAPFKKYLQPADDGMVTRWCPSTFLAEVALPGAVEPLLQQRLVGGGSAATLTTFYSRLLAGPHWRPWFEAKVATVAHLVRPEPKVVTLSRDGRDDIALVEAFVALELALQEAAAAGAATSLPEDTSSELQLREASTLGLAAAPPAAAAASGDGGDAESRAGSEGGAGPAAMRRTTQSAPDLLTSTEQGVASSNGDAAAHPPAGKDSQKPEAVRRLEQQLVESFFSMSLDLKQTMVSTPARLALLMSLVEKEEHHEELQQLVAGLA